MAGNDVGTSTVRLLSLPVKYTGVFANGVTVVSAPGDGIEPPAPTDPDELDVDLPVAWAPVFPQSAASAQTAAIKREDVVRELRENPMPGLSAPFYLITSAKNPRPPHW